LKVILASNQRLRINIDLPPNITILVKNGDPPYMLKMRKLAEQRALLEAMDESGRHRP